MERPGPKSGLSAQKILAVKREAPGSRQCFPEASIVPFSRQKAGGNPLFPGEKDGIEFADIKYDIIIMQAMEGK